MFIKRSWLLLRWTLGLTLLAFLIFARGDRVQADKTQPYGLLTAQQIIARSEPLGRLINPEAGTLCLTATREEHATHRFWLVDCDDAASDHLAQLTWDADSGELVYVTKQTCQTDKTLPLLNRDQAVRHASYWLRSIGIAEPNRRLVLTAPPLLSPWRWIVHFDNGGRKAFVQIDNRSGDLFLAMAWPQDSAMPVGVRHPIDRQQE